MVFQLQIGSSFFYLVIKLFDLGNPHLQRRPSPLYLKHHQQSSPRQVISKKN
jgi:hypothetical protein